MQIKHTFLLVLFLGLAWVGLLFAHDVGGPDPGVDGVFGPTCNQSGCHNTFAVNSGTGSITVTGIPADGWNPGQEYPITVTVQGGLRYGFQMSAVRNTGSTIQAGSFRKTDSRILIQTSGGIQYIQHSMAQLNGTFQFFWTAPASASFGDVRFNAAGNAANGDFNNTGDHIYTFVSVKPALVVVAPQITTITASSTPPLANQSFDFTITGANFDAASAIVAFTGPGCATGCAATVTSRTTTEITGNITLASGSFSVTVQNGAGGTSSNPVALAVTTVAPFTLTNLSSISKATDGSGSLSLGFAKIQPASGNTTPGGVLIFGSRSGGVLLTESGVPASPAITSGRIYARVSGGGGAGSVNTGIAIANPNPTAANITFTFINTAGTQTSGGTCSIPPNHAIGQFLNEAVPCPFNSGAIQGTFSFQSNVPVAAIALRSLIPEDGKGALFSTLPVVDTTVSTGTGASVLAHFADGTEWITEVVLVNPTTTTLSGTVTFTGEGTGTTTPSPVIIATDKGTNSTFNYTIQSQSSFSLRTNGASNPLAVGSVRIQPTGGAAPSSMLIFSHKPGGGVTVAEAGVPSINANKFRMYYELFGSGAGSVLSAIAIANNSAISTNLNFEIYNLAGTMIASKLNQPLQGNGHIARSIDEIFAGQTLPPRGILRVFGDTGARISVVGIRSRYNELNKYLFTTTPASDEEAGSISSELYFPRLVNGGDWSTQFVLFSGTAGQSTSGQVLFLDNNGDAINLNLN